MTTPDEPDLVAAELALGVLDGEERAAALRRVLADPPFAREVERWRRHFAALYAEVPAVEPGPDVTRRIAAIGEAAPPLARRWRAVAAVASVAAAILLAVVLVRPTRAPVAPAAVAHPGALLVAVLKPQDAVPFAVIVDPTTHEIRLRGTVPVAPGRAAELWAIGADGVPHAAGLLASVRGGRMAIGDNVAITAGTTLAISIEPPGGSPKSTPTGPVVATGTLATI